MIIEYLPGYVSQLASKVERRIWRFAENCEGPLIYWSGGKDSTAIVLAYERAMGERARVAISPVPGQARLDYIMKIAKALGYELERCEPAACRPRPGVILVVAKKTVDFWSALEEKGLPVNVPGQRKRWCCSLYKSEPLERVPHSCAIAGYKFSDSVWRARLYSSLDPELPVYRAMRPVLAPLFDLRDTEVWALLRSYSEEVYSILQEWYREHPRSPDCVLCVLAGVRSFERAARAEPALARRALRAMEKLEGRYRPGSASEKRAKQYISILRRAAEGAGP